MLFLVRHFRVAQAAERYREDVPERPERVGGAGLLARHGQRLAARLPRRPPHGGVPAEDEPGVRRRGHRHRAHSALQDKGGTIDQSLAAKIEPFLIKQ